jgi:alkanesulfonate monooxygenase SsuD/methylene tetrahydromethanopterin reductase-like flavin-dependent oxidoreductase (luciferase family)
VAAAAMAARTRRIPIAVSALLPNLYDPLRLAEDIAVLDLMSGGRVSYTMALGYREEEYAAFGREWRGRGAALERRLETLIALWAGDEVILDGRAVRLSPLPLTRPHPMLFYGGGSPAAARRAARLGLPFQPQVDDAALLEAYAAECRAHGREPGWVLAPKAAPAVVLAAEDPEAFWAEHGECLLADARGYAAWGDGAPSHVRDDAETVADLRAGDRYLVATPDDLVARSRAGGLDLVIAHPLCGGLPAEPSWESLRLLGERVLPALRPG